MNKAPFQIDHSIQLHFTEIDVVVYWTKGPVSVCTLVTSSGDRSVMQAQLKPWKRKKKEEIIMQFDKIFKGFWGVILKLH